MGSSGYILISQGGFYHDDIRAFFNIQRDFPHGFVAVARVHLVPLAVAFTGSGICRGAEGSVIGGSKFGAVGHDGCVSVACVVQRFAHGGNVTIHHVGGGDDIRAAPGLADSQLGQVGQGLVIVHGSAVRGQNAAVTVGGVFAEAGVGDDHHLRIFRLDGFAGPLYGFVVVPGAASFFIFVRGEAEQQHGGDAQLYCFVYGFHHPVHRPLVIVFQSFNFVLDIFARYHK